MPNFAYTNQTNFRPFSYQEMLAPVLMANEAHQKLEEAYSELGSKADLMKMYANEVPDSKTANMYNSYAKDLEKQASMLAKHGLTPASRQGLLNMKRRYSSEVVPIETAVARREALIKEQRDALLRDKSLMFDIDYSKTQLDYLLDNPNATYNPISGNELTERAAQMASNLAKVVQGNPKYQSILGGQYFQQMTQMGYTPAQIMQTILDDDNAPAELRQIAETVFNDAGLSKYSQDIQDRARGFINSGLYEGIGTAKYDAMSNRGYISPAERKRLDMEKDRLEMAKEQQQWAKEQKEDERLGIKLPDNTRVKPIGGGRVLVTKPDGTWEVKTASSSGTESVSDALTKATKISDTPFIVARTNGKWHSSENGKDVKGTLLGFTRSNVVSNWGNYTLDNVNDKATFISDFSSIPREAAEKILSTFNDNNLDRDKYVILQVPAESNRAGGRYDYVLMPKDQVSYEAMQKNAQNEGLEED